MTLISAEPRCRSVNRSLNKTETPRSWMNFLMDGRHSTHVSTISPKAPRKCVGSRRSGLSSSPLGGSCAAHSRLRQLETISSNQQTPAYFHHTKGAMCTFSTQQGVFVSHLKVPHHFPPPPDLSPRLQTFFSLSIESVFFSNCFRLSSLTAV